MTVSTQLKNISKYRIDLPKSYKLLEVAIERYNAQYRKPRVKLPHIFLAREMIRLYAREFQRWQAARGFDVELDWQEMPLLAANNQFLGEITGRTDRSIRNYRKALENAGFLAVLGYDEAGEPEYSVHHGRTCDFELAISPEFFWIEGRKSTARLQVRNAPTLCSRKNFPPTSTSTSTCTEQEQLELVGGKFFVEAENFSASDTPEPPEQLEPTSGMQPEQPEPVNRNEQRRQQAGEESGPAEAEARLDWSVLARSGAKTLYNLAKAWLYPGEVFPAGRRQAILARLASLYGDPPRPNVELSHKITRIYAHRLKLAHLYWHREYGALPGPEIFFDTGNTENGFILTKKWPDDPASYPPPPRATYRMPNGNRRGPGRLAKATEIGELINRMR